ncbi:biliverdin-producing heme oxygenase [Oscillatoria salina]|uniref:biliverdin-producing heme oxygenase n=1 Tax=Oscillatoria salina TaxID=331517 RepID=UPI0013B9DF5A|nr:heme oxygenase (biliverdin-producing) [Oscillatoria salina]MBZ8178578.1 heme oxygenase (biliverdin-producing) [Oscillatoria salina IIICB1]NET87327.1 heme oxygenase (biliverdin-producing) [Kamptonema sp. SIO1D9]
MSNNLAISLRAGTKESHTAAENTAFMKCFLKGIVTKQSFQKLLGNLYFVYNALEEELLRHSQHPVVSLIYFPELNRQANLEADLAFYYGNNWQNLISAAEAGKAYVNHIHHIANTEPALLVAHSYVRYLGDLSGGQGLRNIVRSALDLPLDRGTKFYEFDQIPTVEAKRDFKQKYRQALDSLPVDEAMVQKIVDEANYVFTLNRNVMHELEADVKASLDPDVFEAIVNQNRPGSTSEELVNA